MKKCHCLQQDLNPGPCVCKSNIIPTQPQQLDTPSRMQKWFIYESLPQISFLVMKVVSYGLAQRILVKHGVSLVSILNIPSLSRTVGRISGESLVRCAPSRFSLPPSFDRGYSRILTLWPPSITIIILSPPWDSEFKATPRVPGPSLRPSAIGLHLAPSGQH